MKEFDDWETLKKYYTQGALAWIDLAFAKSALKQVRSNKEEHAALLATLFALARQGHLALDLSHGPLAFALQQLGMSEPEPMVQLILRGASTLSPQITAVVRSNNHFYLQKNWIYESTIVSRLAILNSSTPTLPLPSPPPDPTLNVAQRQAVEKAAAHCVCFLTGGPGTGKTFTAAAFVRQMLDQNPSLRILLTAPTGKAVAQLEGHLRKILSPDTSLRAGTLHSVLGIRAGPHEEEIIPLYADLIIVDECSMVDAHIFSRLLSSILAGSRLLLIGDKDQLPPVEAGSIFADLLDSGLYPATHLTLPLRSERAEILTLAKHIREANVDAALQFLEAAPDIDFQQETSPQQLWQRYKHRFPSPLSHPPVPEQLLSRLGNFTLLSCVRKGPLGVDLLNNYFLHQCLKNPTNGTWWVAPIMITRNDHDLQLYNGDLGFLVRKVTPDFSLERLHGDDYALFHDRHGGYVQLPALALTTFEYSYCLSVHKSQGSEYDEVLILCPTGSELFGREVLYTAVTRAKSKVSLCGAKPLLSAAIGMSSRKLSGITPLF